MEHELSSMIIGHTKNVNGYAVTRWSENAYEVGTWGRTTVDLKTALEQLKVAR